MIQACLECTKKRCDGKCDALKGESERRNEARRRRWKERAEEQERKPRGRPRKLYEMDGEALTAYEWGRRYGVPGALVARRLRDGVSIREAVTPSERVGRRYLTARGRTMSMASWARALTVHPHSLWAKLKREDGDLEKVIAYYERSYGVRIDAATSGDAAEGGDQPGEV